MYCIILENNLTERIIFRLDFLIQKGGFIDRNVTIANLQTFWKSVLEEGMNDGWGIELKVLICRLLGNGFEKMDG